MVPWRVRGGAGETEAAGWEGLVWNEVVEGSGSGSGKVRWGKWKRWDCASHWRASAEISTVSMVIGEVGSGGESPGAGRSAVGREVPRKEDRVREGVSLGLWMVAEISVILIGVCESCPGRAG
jgi:hypothetical protein